MFTFLEKKGGEGWSEGQGGGRVQSRSALHVHFTERGPKFPFAEPE